MKTNTTQTHLLRPVQPWGPPAALKCAQWHRAWACPGQRAGHRVPTGLSAGWGAPRCGGRTPAQDKKEEPMMWTSQAREPKWQIFNDILNTFSVWHSVCSEVFCALEKNTVVGASRSYMTSIDLFYWTNKLAVKTLVAPKITPRDPSFFIVQLISEWVFTLLFENRNKWWTAWKSNTEEPSATPTLKPAPHLGGDKCELGRCKSLWKPRLVSDSESAPDDLPTDPLAERHEGSPLQ